MADGGWCAMVRTMTERVDVGTVRSLDGGPGSPTTERLTSLNVELTRRVLRLVEAETLELADGTVEVLTEVFTSQDRFEADRAMMARVPHVVGWGGEIRSPGDYTTKDVAGTSVLLVRGEAGEVRAFVNACAHRGTAVASGCGHAARFTCPYHSWSYDREGRLVGLPSRDMFDPSVVEGLGLVPLPAREVAGLLVVALDPANSLDGAFAEVEATLEAYGFDDYGHVETATLHLEMNWKLAVDVNFEGYHFPFLHKATLAPYCTNNSAFDTFGPHCMWAFPFRDIVQLAGVPEETWPERFTGTVVYGMLPSTVLIEGVSSSQMLRAYPGDSPGTCVVHLSQGRHHPIETDEELRAGRDGLQAALDVLRDEDFPAAEQCQHGAERALRNIVLGRNEPLLQHLHRGWDAAIGSPHDD